MKPERVTLVTGTTGFVGGQVMARWSDVVPWPRIDLTNRTQVETTVKQILQDHVVTSVVHLAASSSIRGSFADPLSPYEVNVMGTVYLLEALAQARWSGRFLFISSGAVYGDPQRLSMPVTEGSATEPTSPYAASKLAAEQIVLEWARRTGAEALVARPFNHTGPGQTDHYFLPSMVSQIVRAPRGSDVVLEVGNLAPFRDFLHVHDVLDAYFSILESGRSSQIYNVASGRSVSLESMLLRLAELSERSIRWNVDSALFRAETVRPMEISIERIQGDTGWSPKRDLDVLLLDLLKFWETRH